METTLLYQDLICASGEAIRFGLAAGRRWQNDILSFHFTQSSSLFRLPIERPNKEGRQ